MKNFVIQKHEHVDTHYDLMIEHSDTLLTWQFQKIDIIKSIQCRKIHDHRLEYLTFEGPVSKNRGKVTIWDKGTYNFIKNNYDELEIEFFGEKIQDIYTLTKIENDIWIFTRK